MKKPRSALTKSGDSEKFKTSASLHPDEPGRFPSECSAGGSNLDFRIRPEPGCDIAGPGEAREPLGIRPLMG